MFGRRERRGAGREASVVFGCSPNSSSQMGGAMAPPMKDLPRWLEENPEFAVAPDWTDIVKQSVSTTDTFKIVCLFISPLAINY